MPEGLRGKAYYIVLLLSYRLGRRLFKYLAENADPPPSLKRQSLFSVSVTARIWRSDIEVLKSQTNQKWTLKGCD